MYKDMWKQIVQKSVYMLETFIGLCILCQAITIECVHGGFMLMQSGI
jgi:hypothetical protein